MRSSTFLLQLRRSFEPRDLHLHPEHPALVLVLIDMAISTSDGEHAVSTTEHEKGDHSPVVQQVGAEVSFDIDAHDLPKGYFRSPSFLGTMLAVGLAFAGVSTLPLCTTTNEANFEFRAVAHFLSLHPSLVSSTTILVLIPITSRLR